MLGSAKKFKATLSTETRTRLNSTRSRPGSPTKRSPLDQVTPRPKTPSTPRREESPIISEMDVSRIDPEEVLVDFQNIEAGDISAEIDEAMLKDAVSDDKVLVSIRYAIHNSLTCLDSICVLKGSAIGFSFYMGHDQARYQDWPSEWESWSRVPFRQHSHRIREQTSIHCCCTQSCVCRDGRLQLCYLCLRSDVQRQDIYLGASPVHLQYITTPLTRNCTEW